MQSFNNLNTSALQRDAVAMTQLKVVIARALGNVNSSAVHVVFPASAGSSVSASRITFEVKLTAETSGFSSGSAAYSSMTQSLKKANNGSIQAQLVKTSLPIFQGLTLNASSVSVTTPVYANIRTAVPSYNPTT